MKLKFVVLFAILLIFAVFPLTAFASEYDIINEQLESSGAEKLEDELDSETKEHLEKSGVELTAEAIYDGLDPAAILDEVLSIANGSSRQPLKTCAVLLGIIVLCAVMSGLNDNGGKSKLYEAAGAAFSAASCAVILVPLAAFFDEALSSLEACCNFTSVFTPVLATVAAVSGKAVSASSYGAFMLMLTELVSLGISKVISPLLRIFLSVALIGALSPDMGFRPVGELAAKAVKWILGFFASLSVGIIGICQIAASASDNASAKAVKFVVSSAVPVIGGSVGDAIGAVRGSLEVLRSGVGAFGIIASGFIFLPPLVSAALWSIGTALCAVAAELFSLDRIAGLLHAVSSALSLLISIIVFAMIIFTVSPAVLLR